jgi:Protein of unknown function (DUF3800)
MLEQYSEYIIYVDESGDHQLEAIDSDYPIFVLAFCLVKKSDYISSITPAIQRFKFKFFGHDMIVLHEQEIRKAVFPFNFLTNKDIRDTFISDLNQIVEKAPFTVLASVIHKQEHVKQSPDPENPYNVSLKHCLEMAFEFLKEQETTLQLTYVVVESRGKREDQALELAFRRTCQGENRWKAVLPFALEFADKKRNSSGLQLADLIARPIGRHFLKPQQPNRAYDIIKPKLLLDIQSLTPERSPK